MYTGVKYYKRGLIVRRIMLVEDDQSLAEVVVDYLVFEGYTPFHFESGREAIKSFAEVNPELVILDVMLPEMTGFEVIHEIRKTSDVPVIFISAKADDYNVMKGYDLGADDYVGKPFRPKILMAKVNSLITRCYPDQVKSSQFKVYDFTFVDAQVKALYLNQDLKLTPKEYDLFKLLTMNEKHIFSYEAMIASVDGEAHQLTANTISAHVKNIRKKMKINGANPESIKTIWGVGYRFEWSR